jgi:hypothetical protein
VNSPAAFNTFLPCAVWPFSRLLHVLRIYRRHPTKSVRSVGIQRSAWAFAFGAWTGVRITLVSSLRNTSWWSVPLACLQRRWILYRSRNPEATLAFERARLSGTPSPPQGQRQKDP